jgi:hypothetical protein
VGADRHGLADFGEVQVEGAAIGVRQHQSRAGSARRTGGAEYIGPVVAPVAGSARPCSLPGPDPGQRALLANASFVLDPDFERLAVRARR